MTISVCTAMDMVDNAGGIRKGLDSENPAVSGLSWNEVNDSAALFKRKPFERYENHLEGYNVSSGEKINKGPFSLLDHQRMVREYISLLDG